MCSTKSNVILFFSHFMFPRTKVEEKTRKKKFFICKTNKVQWHWLLYARKDREQSGRTAQKKLEKKWTINNLILSISSITTDHEVKLTFFFVWLCVCVLLIFSFCFFSKLLLLKWYSFICTNCRCCCRSEMEAKRLFFFFSSSSKQNAY